MKVVSSGGATPAEIMGSTTALDPPDTRVEPGSPSAPVKEIKADDLKALGQKLWSLFTQYRSDRVFAEQRWLRNQRQYLGLYDNEIEGQLGPNRSKAYPKLTRVKSIQTVSRLMNLMFPGNERNWELHASPDPDVSPEDVKVAIAEAQKRDGDAGLPPARIDIPYVLQAIRTFSEQRAEKIAILIDDQLQEIGGDQTLDYIGLERRVLQSGVIYGLGLLRGPFVRTGKSTSWTVDDQGQPQSTSKDVFKPMFEFLPIWDFYPDMSAKTLRSMDGYFTRSVMSRSQVRALADRDDFFGSVIKSYLKGPGRTGNYRPQNFETELRAMGVKITVNDQKTETSKYEVLVWNGPVSGEFLALAGVPVDEDKLADELDAEIWMIESTVIKASLNPWAELGVDVKTIHPFIFDEDDTSPVGAGLPNVMRDSQMSLCAATRMLLDNASIVCGPNMEVNVSLMRQDQDLSSVTAYKIWYRDDEGMTSQYPAVRRVEIDGHINELMGIIKLFMEFADIETFVGPMSGGDSQRTPSEPMRTAAGASMLRGDAALPFKDIVRNFDFHTQSVIEALVQFNRKFNPDRAPEGDYNVVARGATSLIAKEVRGMQIDQLATTLKPEEMIHVDERKLVEARFKVRDMGDLLVSEDEANRRKQAAEQSQAAMQQKQEQLAEANIRKLLSDSFKNISQGQKNSANADATSVETALDLMEQGVQHAIASATQAGAAPAPGGAQPAPIGAGSGNVVALPGVAPGGGQGQAGLGPAPGFPAAAG